MKKLIFAILVLMSFISINAQENFEGTIYFDIKIDAPDLDPQAAAMMPKEATMYLSENKVCTKQKTMLTEQKVIVNAQEKMFWILFSMMGQNMAIHSTFDEAMADVDATDIPDAVYLDEFETIAGYKCQKVTMNYDGTEMTAFVTKEIKGFENMYLDNPIYNKMNGFLMKMHSKVEGITMIMTAREVVKGAVDASIFAIPDNYQKMTMEEFQSMMGGGR